MSTLISYLERYEDITLILQCLSIIAVHGLGANPDWAWTGKRAGRTSGDEIHVNWLKDEDMLPSKMPNARIMTFNYESKWHKDAPRQRRSLCANQLLTALDNQRKQASTHSIQSLIPMCNPLSYDRPFLYYTVQSGNYFLCYFFLVPDKDGVTRKYEPADRSLKLGPTLVLRGRRRRLCNFLLIK